MQYTDLYETSFSDPAFDFSSYFARFSPVVQNNELLNYSVTSPSFKMTIEDPRIPTFYNYPSSESSEVPIESSTVTNETSDNTKAESTTTTTKTSDEPTKKSTNPGVRQKIVDTARKHIGGKYVWGGNGYSDKKGGFDCSGLIYYAYTQNGFDKKKMPRQSSLFEKFGKKVTLDEAQPGDIIHTKGHVKMLSKKVNGQWYVVEAAGRKTGIVERPLKSTSNIISIRNYVDYLYKGGKLIPRYRYLKNKL